jgi:hypothetical protein
MTTLSDILQTTAIDLGITDSFTASTTGTVTTTINSAFNNESEPPDEDRFKNNYLLVRRDAAGANADPEGKWALISGYDPVTWTITHATLTPGITAAGDELLLIEQSNFPLLEMVAAVNRALKKMGDHYFTDITSITIAADQTEYTLPAAVRELLDVQIASDTDTNDYGWKSIPGCRIIQSASAMTSAPLLYIPQQSTGYTIMLHYKGLHPTVVTYDDVIDKFIPEELLVAATKMCLLESFINSQAGSAKPHWGNMYAEAQRQFNEGKILLPVQKLKGKTKHGIMWSGATATDDFTWPSA